VNVRAGLKTAAFWAATIAAAPALASYWIRSMILGSDRALEGSTQALSLMPGVCGQYLRRAFLSRALTRCDRTATIAFGTIFSRAGARIDEYVYVGPGCHLGLVHLERECLIGAGVHIPSGPATHGTEDLSKPIREQPGRERMVRIGAGSWIGSAAIVLADVGCESIVGAGAVVTHDVPDRVLAAGVPAKVVRSREPSDQQVG